MNFYSYLHFHELQQYLNEIMLYVFELPVHHFTYVIYVVYVVTMVEI
jgi:hypothetical protein